MKSFLTTVTLTVLFITGCDQGEDGANPRAPSSDSHRAAVAKVQDGQASFEELIATVRDERSFDAAKPELGKVVSKWREAAASLAELEPPSEDLQAEFRMLITEGHRATEPTGEDMLRLISIESREAEVTRWLEEFEAAAGAVAAEMARLYGPTDYAGYAGLPIDRTRSESATPMPQDRQAEQGAAGQPATPPRAGD
jgi:hypothetical protein